MALPELSDLSQALQKLRLQEQELLAALDSLDKSFEALGVPLNSAARDEALPDSQIDYEQELRRSGIRMGDKLSFRGRDKAAEYFELVDQANLGRIGYPEFKGADHAHFVVDLLRLTQ